MNNYSKIQTSFLQNIKNKNKEESFYDIISTDNNTEEIKFYEFIEDNKKIINISIQAQPGLKFYINDNINPIIIGPTGFFSWEIKTPNTYIYSVKIKDYISWERGWINESGKEVNSENSLRYISDYIPILQSNIKSQNLSIDDDGNKLFIYIYQYSGNKQFISRSLLQDSNNYEINLNEETKYIRIGLYKAKMLDEYSEQMVDNFDIQSLDININNWPIIHPQSTIIITYEYLDDNETEEEVF